MEGKTYTTEEIKKIVEPIAREYGVKRLSLFGSYARGEAGPDSDIDIRLVEAGEIRGWFKLAGFSNALKDRFGQKVDVVDISAREFLDDIANDEVVIFEQS